MGFSLPGTNMGCRRPISPGYQTLLTRQLVFELVGNRTVAEKLTIRVWADRSAFQASGHQVTEGSLLIDAPEILRK